MKKSRIIILIVIILIICAIAGVIFYIDKKGKEPLFRYSYEKIGFACNYEFLFELLVTLENYCFSIFNNN